jgi:hypothetical protein
MFTKIYVKGSCQRHCQAQYVPDNVQQPSKYGKPEGVSVVLVS